MVEGVYNLALLSDRGFEDIIINDIKNVLKKEVSPNIIYLEKLTCIMLRNISFKDAIKLAYVLGSVRDILYLLVFNRIADLSKIDEVKLLMRPYKLRLEIIKDKKYKNISFIEYLKKRLKFSNGRVNNKILIRGYIIGEYAIIGIPLLEKVSDRGYLIKKSNTSVNPTAAHLILKRIWNRKDLLVINVKDGVLPIEAGLILKNIPVHFWDKNKFVLPVDIRDLIEFDNFSMKSEKFKVMAVDSYGKNISVAKKNAINALVKDIIYFRRLNIDYLDLLIRQKYENIIADFYKIQKDKLKFILYSSKYLLEEGGKLILLSDKKITNLVLKYCSKYNLNLVDIKTGRFLQDRYVYYIIAR